MFIRRVKPKKNAQDQIESKKLSSSRDIKDIISESEGPGFFSLDFSEDFVSYIEEDSAAKVFCKGKHVYIASGGFFSQAI